MIVVGLSILATTMWTARSEAHCHIYHVWHYLKPQRCFTAMAPKRFDTDVKPASRIPETFHEQIYVPVPSLDFEACPEGDDRLMGIARLRALSDVPPADK